MAETNLESHGSFQKLGAIEPSCNVPGSLHSGKRRYLIVQEIILKHLKTIHPFYSGHWEMNPMQVMTLKQ